MKDIKRLIYVVLCAAFFIGFFILSDHYAGEAVGKYANEISTGNGKLISNDSVTMDSLSVENQIMQYVSTVSTQDIHLSFVGDITFETSQFDRYYDQTKEEFDFSNSFKYIAKYLRASNFAAGNFEGVMAGPDENYESVYDQYGTAGYLYNMPESVAGELKNAGISILQTANAHSGDFGIEGVKSTLKYLADAGIKSTGTQQSAKEKRYTIASVSSMKIAYIAYTNSLNIDLSDENSYGVNTLNGYDTDKDNQLNNDIRAAKREGADFVVVMICAGDEYGTEPDESKKNLFDALFDAGADIVIGNQPFSLQPIEVKDLVDSDGLSKKGIAIYSLGTFLGSEQYQENGLNNDIGAIFDVVINKEGNKKPQITGIKLTPTAIVYTDSDIFVMPVAEVKNNADKFSDVVDETAMDRINTAYDDIIPGLIQDSGLKGSYSGNSYVVNF